MNTFSGIPFLYWRYYEGTKGIGGWTTKPDREGWFYAFYCKPTGPGARSGLATSCGYVPRLTTKRRKRKDARKRAWELSNGDKRIVKEKVVAQENPPGTGYCMSCKIKVLIRDAHSDLTDKGRQVIKGWCPTCNTRIQKFGKIAECPECLEMKEMAATDYLCKECRGT